MKVNKDLKDMFNKLIAMKTRYNISTRKILKANKISFITIISLIEINTKYCTNR